MVSLFLLALPSLMLLAAFCDCVLSLDTINAEGYFSFNDHYVSIHVYQIKSPGRVKTRSIRKTVAS